MDLSHIKKVIVDVDCFLYPIGFAAAASGMSEIQALDKLHAAVSNLHKALETDYTKWVLPMTGSGPVKYRDRFRNTIPYKENRKDSKTKPLHVPDMQDLLKSVFWEKAYICDPVDGEADDFVAMEAWESFGVAATGWENVLIVGVDKDLKQIPGLHYNPNTGTFEEIGPNEADYIFNKQVLTGDTADRIPGLPGIGPAKAEKLMSKYARYGTSYADVTLQAYLDSDLKGAMTPTEIADYYFETCNLLYLRRSLTDVWEFGK